MLSSKRPMLKPSSKGKQLVRSLSENEMTALRLLVEGGGSLIEWRVPETNEKDPVFGIVTPGHTTYRKLEKLGLVFYTEEEPFDLPGDPLDGFCFSREIYIDDAGREALRVSLAGREMANEYEERA